MCASRSPSRWRRSEDAISTGPIKNTSTRRSRLRTVVGPNGGRSRPRPSTWMLHDGLPDRLAPLPLGEPEVVEGDREQDQEDDADDDRRSPRRRRCGMLDATALMQEQPGDGCRSGTPARAGRGRRRRRPLSVVSFTVRRYCSISLREAIADGTAAGASPPGSGSISSAPMPAARAPSTSSSGVSPTWSASAGAQPASSSAGAKIAGSGLRAPAVAEVTTPSSGVAEAAALEDLGQRGVPVRDADARQPAPRAAPRAPAPRRGRARKRIAAISVSTVDRRGPAPGEHRGAAAPAARPASRVAPLVAVLPVVAHLGPHRRDQALRPGCRRRAPRAGDATAARARPGCRARRGGRRGSAASRHSGDPWPPPRTVARRYRARRGGELLGPERRRDLGRDHDGVIAIADRVRRRPAASSARAKHVADGSRRAACRAPPRPGSSSSAGSSS